MKKGFTLIELLVVISVMATLMTIMFRLGNIASDDTSRIATVTRLQKLENCLAGYYSAFGSYPPVAIYGSRNIYTAVECGVQTDERNESLTWDQIMAACRSQPIAAVFPFPDDNLVQDEINRHAREMANQAQSANCHWSDAAKQKYGSGLTGEPYNLVNDSLHWKATSWKKVQIFKFGLMSYLLPRYLMMMSGPKEFYGADNSDACAQWTVNNEQCIDPVDGNTKDWYETYDNVQRYGSGLNSGEFKDTSKYVRVANMPTQAVCGRWIMNLQNLCATCSLPESQKGFDKIFGVDIAATYNTYQLETDGSAWGFDEWNEPKIEAYSVDQSGSDWYLLNSITVRDGWGNEFFYYSPNGSQSYTLWSAGKNGYTFPPWADKEGMLDQKPELGSGVSGEQITIAVAIADDIMRMNH